MARNFHVPTYYRSPLITAVKRYRAALDPHRQDSSPTAIELGPVVFRLARHFGFCFGVEQAIEIAYRALEENPGKQVFLLSEMIHNPEVNGDLRERGVRFLMGTDGRTLIPFSDLNPDDIVIVPAFGTTIEIQQELKERGIDPYLYDTTCPFVQKVWRRAADLGKRGFTVVIHGKRTHEETRATFSHSRQGSPSIIVRDMADTRELIAWLLGQRSVEQFNELFARAISPGFDPQRDLQRVGVVNQTTMLASETQEIALAIREALVKRHGEERVREFFADTRDTLCYATYENQGATRDLIGNAADLAVVVGGYNSSNTSHLVELCEDRMKTFYVRNEGEISGPHLIHHFDFHKGEMRTTSPWLPATQPVRIAITSGASCPDAMVEGVIRRIASFFPGARSIESVTEEFEAASRAANL